MKISIYTSKISGADIAKVCEGLEHASKALRVRNGGEIDVVGVEVVRNPTTYESLPAKYLRDTESDDFSIIVTENPYENNYFWDTPDPKRVITSLYGWPHLTQLPKNNGIVLFVCALLVRHLRIGASHYTHNTGCINDYWRDKTGIDIAMRSAYVCAACLAINKKTRFSKANVAVLADIHRILDQLSTASRANNDLCSVWSTAPANTEFDVFLCHNAVDKPAARTLNKFLKLRGIRTWIDEEQLPPGRPWQDLLETQIASIRSAAVLVGDSGLGPWQNTESRAFLGEFVNRQCPVIPVILRGCITAPQLPLFLSQHTWVDFRRKSPNPMNRLIWGITGELPQ